MSEPPLEASDGERALTRAVSPSGPLWHFAESRGISRQEFDEARQEGGVGAVMALIAQYIALPGPRRWSAARVQELAHVDPTLADRLWRAMGFTQMPPEATPFTDADIEALSIGAALVNGGLISQDLAVQQTRVMSRLMSRIASSHQDAMGTIPERIAEDIDPETMAADLLNAVAAQTLALDRLLVYLYRRHLAAEIDRRRVLAQQGEGGPALVVGFADLVGFTALSQELGEPELAQLIEDFGAVATEVVGRHGGQIVKMIGDEVMFSADQPRPAVAVALELEEGIPQLHEDLSLRAGLAWGPALAREGDLFGPTVNLASRLTNYAKPGTVLISDELAELVGDDPGLRLRHLRPRSLKGLGRIRAHAVSAAD